MRAAESAASGGMFLFGIVVALLGAVLPLVSEPLGLGLDSAAHLFLALNGAILVGSLAVGLVIDRRGYRGPLVLGPAVIGVALVLVPEARSLPALLGAVTLLGLGGSVMNVAPNALVADLYGEPRPKAAALNRLGVFFGFGALFLPFLIGALLGRLGLRPLVLSAAGLCVLVAALSTLPRLPPTRPRHVSSSPAEALLLLRRPFVAALAALLFCEAANEMLLGGLLTTFLVRETGATIAEASWVLAGYWMALMTGRLLLGRLLLRVSGAALLPLMAAGATAALALLALEPSFPATAALFVAAAFFLAGVFPTTLGLAAAAEPERTGTVFGLLLSVSVVGAMVVPWIGGQLAAAHGLRVVPVLGTGVFVAVLLLAVTARRLRPAPPAASRAPAPSKIRADARERP